MTAGLPTAALLQQLAMLARQSGTAPGTITRAFIDLGVRLGLDWAQQAAERADPADPWERLLCNSLARDFQHMRLEFLRRVGGRKADPLAQVERWAEAQAPAIRQFRSLVARAEAASPASTAMLAQIAGQARNLLGR